jgi:hypothetical protein
MDRLADDVRAQLARHGGQGAMVELLARWSQAVGEQIARFAWPARVARDGTLHVNTADSVWAFELSQRAREIAERLGVPAVRFRPGPLPEAERGPGGEPVQPSAEDEQRAAALAAVIEDVNLRESVQKAVSFSLARARSTRPV